MLTLLHLPSPLWKFLSPNVTEKTPKSIQFWFNQKFLLVARSQWHLKATLTIKKKSYQVVLRKSWKSQQQQQQQQEPQDEVVSIAAGAAKKRRGVTIGTAIHKVSRTTTKSPIPDEMMCSQEATQHAGLPPQILWCLKAALHDGIWSVTWSCSRSDGDQAEVGREIWQLVRFQQDSIVWTVTALIVKTNHQFCQRVDPIAKNHCGKPCRGMYPTVSYH